MDSYFTADCQLVTASLSSALLLMQAAASRVRCGCCSASMIRPPGWFGWMGRISARSHRHLYAPTWPLCHRTLSSSTTPSCHNIRCASPAPCSTNRTGFAFFVLATCRIICRLTRFMHAPLAGDCCSGGHYSRAAQHQLPQCLITRHPHAGGNDMRTHDGVHGEFCFFVSRHLKSAKVLRFLWTMGRYGRPSADR